MKTKDRQPSTMGSTASVSAWRKRLPGLAATFALVLVVSGAPGFVQANPLLQIEPGPIGLASPSLPAEIGFDQPSGKADLASELAGNAVSAELRTPHLGNAQLEAAVGVVEFAFSPFVAGYAALKGGHRQLTSEHLSEAEQDLKTAMEAMADQSVFRRAVLEAGRSATRRALVDLAGTDSLSATPFAARVETSVLKLRLYRARNTDKSFRLRIAARVRITRTADQAIVLDEPFQYESGEGLFVDWTREDGFASVARTGYEALAKRVADRVFAPPSEAPVVLGAAQKPTAAHRHMDLLDAKRLVLTGVEEHRRIPPVIRISAVRDTDAHSLEVLPGSSGQTLRIRGLVEQPESGTAAQTDTEYALDGLENHPNFVVQVAACFGAIPLGLWEHTVGAYRSGNKGAEQAARRLQEISTRNFQAEESLATCIANHLRRQTPAPVWCSVPMKTAQSKPGFFEAPAGHGPRPRPDSKLDIRVSDLALTGKPGRNPRLSLRVEVRAALLRTSDGQELCSWPLIYCGSARRLEAWAANDGSFFLSELRQAYDAIAIAVTEQVIEKGFAPPRGRFPSTFAAN
ncbi:MAG TPA: hypothetical protein VHI52_05945 [Verrucomicrobiae bacterium]|nr:hypothetical protein [Verrucomicrobiae bacterium]